MMNATELPVEDERRPYAPTANITAVIDRVRRVNLPDIIDNGVLRLAGVSEGAMGRVQYALRFLGLTDPNGRPTDRLRAIARAGEEEGRDLLAAVVREAYASDFARLDPSQDPQPRIVSAFKRYEPRSQTERMVMLFLGLCRAAGIPVLDPPRERALQPARPASRANGSTRGSGAPPSHPASRRPAGGEVQPPADTKPPGQVVSISLDDLALIEDEKTYQEVWAALGTVNRAAARARHAKAEGQQGTSEAKPED